MEAFRSISEVDSVPFVIDYEPDISDFKKRRCKKISPPSWAKILFVSPSNEVEEDRNKHETKNPFREKIFYSLEQNCQHKSKKKFETEERFSILHQNGTKITPTVHYNSSKLLTDGSRVELFLNDGYVNRVGAKDRCGFTQKNVKSTLVENNNDENNLIIKFVEKIYSNVFPDDLLTRIQRDFPRPYYPNHNCRRLVNSGSAELMAVSKRVRCSYEQLNSADISLYSSETNCVDLCSSNYSSLYNYTPSEVNSFGLECDPLEKNVIKSNLLNTEKVSQDRKIPVYFELWDTTSEDDAEDNVTSNTVLVDQNNQRNGHLDDGDNVEIEIISSNMAFEMFPSDNCLSECESGIGMDVLEEVAECLEELHDPLELDERDPNVEKKEVLCGNRVSQMTRTYHDIEAVTRLLQEKEKDLELAARIGQQLLARNKCLEEKNANLEAELSNSAERITQLRHDLLMKTDLLQIYTNDVDESSVENTPTGLRHINIDLLQRRVKNLECENVNLREEATQLASDTQYCEEKEKELVHDVIKQLNEANLQVNQMSDELSKKIEDNLRLQEETTQFLAQIVEHQAVNKRLTRENEELGSLVGVARECQQELTTELAELKEKYAEVLDLLHDTQEQLRRVQKKNFPGSRGTHLGGGMFSSLHSGSDSIASELHSLSSGEEPADKADGVKSLNRVFDTVRLSSKLSNSLPPMGQSGGSVYSTPTRQASQLHSHLGTPLHTGGRYSPYFGGSGLSVGYSSGLPSLDSGAESDGSFPTDSEDNYPASRPGVPGWPGTPDLDSCLRRLGPNERNHMYLPYGCRTPDSIMSTGSGKSGLSGYASQDWKFPQKLQIVKPIEGSLTLHQWSRLATPHLGGLLEEKEGIAMKVKGVANSDLNLEVYSMSDLEEDEEGEVTEEEEEIEGKGYPGKQFMSTSGVFTYTNSTVLHPDELTSITSSLRATQMSALPTASVAPSLPPTPSHVVSVPPSRRGSTATFSTNVGLAKHLHERGFTDPHNGSGLPPTATPANSPDGSRNNSPEPQPYKLPGFDDITKHIHAGASFLRRTFYGKELRVDSNPPSPPGPEFNIVERVQEIGVDRLFVGGQGLPRSVGGVVTLRCQSTPPLLHLSNLIRSGAKPPTESSQLSTTSSTTVSSQGPIMSAPKISSPGERRPETPPGAPMGIPGQPGAGHLDSRLTQLKPGQRTDLGTVGSVGNRPRPSTLGSIPLGRKDEKMGTVGWTSLGRKGGLL